MDNNATYYVCKCGMPCKSVEYLDRHIANPKRSAGWSDEHGRFSQATGAQWSAHNSAVKAQSAPKTAPAPMPAAPAAGLPESDMATMLMAALAELANKQAAPAAPAQTELPVLNEMPDAPVETVSAPLGKQCLAIAKGTGKQCTATNGLSVKFGHTVCAAHARHIPAQFVGVSGTVTPTGIAPKQTEYSGRLSDVENALAAINRTLEAHANILSGLTAGMLDSEQSTALLSKSKIGDAPMVVNDEPTAEDQAALDAMEALPTLESLTV